MKILKRISIVCMVLSFLLTDIFCGVGTTSGQFLKIGPSARALGMASSFGAVSDDVYAIHFNPAGLSQIKKEEVSATYLKYFADVNYGFLGYVKPSQSGAMGFGITYLIVDGMEKRDESENFIGNFNAKDMSMVVSYTRKNVMEKSLPGMNIGGTVRTIISEIDQTTAYSASVDIGAFYSPLEKLNIAVVLQNISWGIKYKEEADILPLNLKLAGAYKITNILTVASDIDMYLIDAISYASVGVEYSIGKYLILRGGYRYGYDTQHLGSLVGVAVGMGVRMWNVGVDYAFVPFGDLGDTHRVSLSFRF